MATNMGKKGTLQSHLDLGLICNQIWGALHLLKVWVNLTQTHFHSLDIKSPYTFCPCFSCGFLLCSTSMSAALTHRHLLNLVTEGSQDGIISTHLCLLPGPLCPPPTLPTRTTADHPSSGSWRQQPPLGSSSSLGRNSPSSQTAYPSPLRSQ